MNDFTKQTYSEQVVAYVKDLILNGKLTPGAPVEEAAIAKQLSISRAPVREAMQILIREGLIEAHPQKRKHIKELTAEEIKNSYFAGGVLESAAVAKAIRDYTKKDIAELEKIVKAMKANATKNGSVSAQVLLNGDFHDILFSRIDNRLVVELCKRSCQGTSKYLLYKQWVKAYVPGELIERHKIIIDALKTKDPAIVEQVLREHYVSIGERLAKYGADLSEI